MNESVDRKSAEVAAIKSPSFLAFIAKALQPRIPRKCQTESIKSGNMTNIHILTAADNAIGKKSSNDFISEMSCKNKSDPF